MCLYVPSTLRGDFINKLIYLLITLHWMGICVDFMKRQAFLLT